MPDEARIQDAWTALIYLFTSGQLPGQRFPNRNQAARQVGIEVGNLFYWATGENPPQGTRLMMLLEMSAVAGKLFGENADFSTLQEVLRKLAYQIDIKI